MEFLQTILFTLKLLLVLFLGILAFGGLYLVGYYALFLEEQVSVNLATLTIANLILFFEGYRSLQKNASNI